MERFISEMEAEIERMVPHSAENCPTSKYLEID